MTTLQLTRGNSPFRIGLRLPATTGEIEAVFSELDVISKTERTVITGVISDIPNLGNYISGKGLNDEVLQVLNRMEMKISQMSEADRQIFSGALDAESINSLHDILEIADNLERYTILYGATDDRELGERVVSLGYMQFPANVLPYLDYRAIGAEFYAGHGGAYTEAGYVLRNEALPLQEKEVDAVFNIKLLNSSGLCVYLKLPASETELEQIKERLDVQDFAECHAERTDCLPYLELIPESCFNVEDANELAYAINEMQQENGELMKYLSVLYVENPYTFPQAYRLALEMENYERVLADADEYGRNVLQQLGADDEIIDTIDGYMDFQAFGEAAMEEDGIRKTEFGMIRRLSEPFPEENAYEQKMY